MRPEDGCYLQAVFGTTVCPGLILYEITFPQHTQASVILRVHNIVFWRRWSGNFADHVFCGGLGYAVREPYYKVNKSKGALFDCTSRLLNELSNC